MPYFEKTTGILGEVLDMLGIKLGEGFKVKNDDRYYLITSSGSIVYKNGRKKSRYTLIDLIINPGLLSE